MAKQDISENIPAPVPGHSEHLKTDPKPYIFPRTLEIRRLFGELKFGLDQPRPRCSRMVGKFLYKFFQRIFGGGFSDLCLEHAF
jgi:hypothetical protein